MEKTQAPSRSCCSKCLSSIFTLGVSILITWVILRPSKPKLYIVEFTVPTLNKTAFPTSRQPPPNASISFDLKLKNPNKENGIYYDALDLSFFCIPNLSAPVGNLTIPSFYQGFQKTAHRRESVEMRGGAVWESARRAVSETGRASFQVRLETKIRYRYVLWKTGRHGLNLTANVEVNDQGTKSAEKGVKLHSDGVSWRAREYRAKWMMASGLVMLLWVC